MSPTPDNCPRAWADVMRHREADTITLSPRDVAILCGDDVPCPQCSALAAENVELRNRLALHDPVTAMRLEAGR